MQISHIHILIHKKQVLMPLLITTIQKVECNIIKQVLKEYKTPAKRPEYSSLDNMMLRCTIGDEMRDWKEALKSFFENQQKNQ